MEILAEKGEQSLVEIADALDVAPSTAHRLLSTLHEMEFLQRDPRTKLYRISLKLFRLGVSSIQQMGLAQAAMPEMARLSALTNETVSLGVPHGVDMMYIERIEAQQAVKSEYPLGHTAPIYCTALGKTYLAALPRAEREQLLDSMALVPKTQYTVVEREAIERELERTASAGYAIDDREIDENLRCVAAAIVDRRGRPVGAISIAGPAFRIDVERLHEWGNAVKLATQAISRAMGWTG